MNQGLDFKKIWFDDDLIKLEINSSDGNSLFNNKVYIGYQALDKVIEDLNIFRNQIHGGLYDLEMGGFGPEYALGAFHARLHFQKLGRIYITIKAQSEFKGFGIKDVASEAILYLISEPILLDNFINDLKALRTGLKDEARLEAINERLQ